MNIKDKQIILNGKDITDKVVSINYLDKCNTYTTIDINNLITTIIEYKDGGFQQLGKEDILDVIEIKPKPKPKPKPKFKIGDYVVEDIKGSNKEYIKIYSIIKETKDNFLYNVSHISPTSKSYFSEEDLRKPTKEEYELYFR